MKEKTKIIISVIITFIITISITVTASIVMDATDISFTSDKTDKTNVKDSLDELYNMIDEESSVNTYNNAYGVIREIDTQLSAWGRIGASKGLEANAQIGTTPVKNDFDNIYPWSDIKSYNYDTGTKSITAWYGESGFTFTPTGNIEVLTYIPEFYYKRYQQNGYEYVFISREEQYGFTKSEAFSIGRYTMSGDTTRVHSRSGANPLVNYTITEFRNYARALGNGFGQLDYHYFIIQLLYLVEYADYNSQAKLGLGNTSNTAAITGGGCNQLGMKSGSMVNDGKHSVIYRGIEDIFGNVWQFVDGINMQNSQVYINYNPNTYKIDTFNGDYKKIGYINTKNYGVISKLGYDSKNQLIALPIETLGTAATGTTGSTYITDSYYRSNNGNLVALIGGAWTYAANSGLWNWALDTMSNGRDSYCSARLLKTGQV